MEQLIDFHAPEVQAVLDTLLKDKSTGKNIIWATDPPEELQTVMYEPVTDRSQITTQQLGLTHYEVVLPRMMKQTDTQQQRTRKKGEVFSPAWVCNKMNNALDADWFGALGAGETAGQFTVELPQGWQTVETPVQFPACGGKTPAWVQYVQSRRLEVTCGEAPFLASRYDAATGEMIPVARRIGILDRKLRVVSENATTEDEWRKYATHAVQSTYGYEYQGDNLLLARVNLLLTYAEHLQARWQRKPTKEELQPIATIISWNLWQMDGLRLSVPGGKPQPETEQLDLFSMFGAAEPQPPTVSCKVKNWRKGSHGTAQNFETIQEGSTSMKFDYVIGNPPYQDERQGTSTTALPVYNNFMDASYKVGSSVMLITPARFLFNAGRTPKQWNEQMVDLLEQENPGCFDEPGKTFLDPYMKSGLYITEIVKRLYRSEKMRQAFPDDNARLEHIFAKQVYGLAPTEIIYRIAISYILGFAKGHGITAHHIRQADTLEFAKAGTMERELDKIFRD